jgi:hypothetical protein
LALNFEKAPANQVLDVYQELSGRTVIRSPHLPELLDLKHEPSLTRQQAVKVLEEAFKGLGWMTTNFGDKFVFVLRQKDSDVLPHVREPLVAEPPDGELVPGVLKFIEADPMQVFDIYQELSKRTVLRDQNLPHTKISLRSQTALSRQEAVWALDGVLLLSGIAMVPQKDQFVLAMPLKKKKVPPIKAQPPKSS